MSDINAGITALKLLQDAKIWLIGALITLIIYQEVGIRDSIAHRLGKLELKAEERFTTEDFKRERLLLLAEMAADRREIIAEVSQLKSVMIRVEDNLKDHYQTVDKELDRRRVWMAEVDLFHQKVSMQLETGTMP